MLFESYSSPTACTGGKMQPRPHVLSPFTNTRNVFQTHEDRNTTSLRQHIDFIPAITSNYYIPGESISFPPQGDGSCDILILKVTIRNTFSGHAQQVNAKMQKKSASCPSQTHTL